MTFLHFYEIRTPPVQTPGYRPASYGEWLLDTETRLPYICNLKTQLFLVAGVLEVKINFTTVFSFM